MALVVAFIAITPTLFLMGGHIRVYYGSDTRAPELLIGAAAAIAYSLWKPSPRYSRALLGAALAGIAVLTAVNVGWISADPLQDRGFGFFVAVVSSALIVHLVDNPARPFRLALANRPAVETGRISYAMYLWHYPILVALGQALPKLQGAPRFALVLSLTVAIALVSYRVVELRFLRLKKRLLPNAIGTEPLVASGA